MNIKKKFLNVLPKSLYNDLSLFVVKNRFKGCNINTHMISKSVNLGKNVSIARDVDIRSGVDIGDYSYINSGSIIASGKIGKFVSVGYNVQIGMFEHPTNMLSTSPLIYSAYNVLGDIATWDEIKKPPIIGSDVWIGSNAVVLQGVEIGNGAIIAAGAVVTKDVAPFTIVGGVPAKFIKNRFDEKKIKYLLDLKWWDLKLEDIKKVKYKFENIR